MSILPQPPTPTPKLNLTTATFPDTYLDADHPPLAKPPWRQVREIQFVKSLSLTIPKRLYHEAFTNNGANAEENDIDNLPSDAPSEHPSHETGSKPTSIAAVLSQSRSLARTRYAKAICSLSAILHEPSFGFLPSHAQTSPASEPVSAASYFSRHTYTFLSRPQPPDAHSVSISITNDMLRIDMPHHVYERCGILGDAWQSGGSARAKGKGRGLWTVELDLSARPAATTRKGGVDRVGSKRKRTNEQDGGKNGLSKKAWDRLMYACKNVEGLNEERTWLVTADRKPRVGKRKLAEQGRTVAEILEDVMTGVETNGSRTESAGEETVPETQESNRAERSWLPESFTETHHPTLIAEPYSATTLSQAVIAPFLRSGKPLQDLLVPGPGLEDDIYAAAEYLDLLTRSCSLLQNGRVANRDEHLCSYALPDLAVGGGDVVVDDGKSGEEDVITLRWRGFMTAKATTDLLMQMLKGMRRKRNGRDGGGEWCVISVKGFEVAKGSGKADGVVLLLQTGADEGQEKKSLEDESRKDGEGFKYCTAFEYIDS